MQTAKLLLDMVTATALIILDRLFYEGLDLVKRHGHIEYTQKGGYTSILRFIIFGRASHGVQTKTMNISFIYMFPV
jgi:hypothetical protein